MKWSIITDSSCEYIGNETNELVFDKVPFIINIDGKDYVDNDSLDIEDMMNKMEQSKEASRSACPSPEAWYEKFMQAENCIAITISSGVSGSYNSAQIAKEMALEECPDKKIFVIDSLSAASGLSLIAKKAEEIIKLGHTFEKIVAQLQEYKNTLHTIFALSSFDNLVKNGRMNKIVGVIVSKLGFWGIGGASEEGKIITTGKARGSLKMISSIIDDMKKHGYNCGEIVITHCQNMEIASKLKNTIKEIWNEAQITILATSGLCSYYAERGGLIVAYQA